jgi:hypothetical protein
MACGRESKGIEIGSGLEVEVVARCAVLTSHDRPPKSARGPYHVDACLLAAVKKEMAADERNGSPTQTPPAHRQRDPHTHGDQ